MQFLFGLVGAGIAGGDVPGTTVADFIGQFFAAGLFESVDHVQNAVSVARAEVVDVHARFPAVFDCGDMPQRKIHDVI